MSNVNAPPITCHSEADPPDVLALKVEHLRAALRRIVQEENEALLERHRAMQPLLSIKDVACTLGVSKRTAETLVAEGELRPLWIKGQRRFHPDAVNAYLRSTATNSRRSGRVGR